MTRATCQIHWFHSYNLAISDGKKLTRLPPTTHMKETRNNNHTATTRTPIPLPIGTIIGRSPWPPPGSSGGWPGIHLALGFSIPVDADCCLL